MNRALSGGERVSRSLRWLVAGFYLLLVFGPFYWILISSLKPAPEVIQTPPTLFPAAWSFEHYQKLFASTDYGRYLRSSIFIAVFSTLFSMVLAFLASYALYRLQFPGKTLMFRSILGVYVFPSILLIVPLYGLFADVGLLNSHWALVIVNVTFIVPFAIWLLRAFLEGIPRELEEAAYIDGASFWTTMFRVTLPMTAPGLASAATFAFIYAWTEYPFASAFILQDTKRTLPVGLSAIIGQYQIDWGLLAAGAVVMILPAVVFFALVGLCKTAGRQGLGAEEEQSKQGAAGQPARSARQLC